ncbi:uncharacterized protein HD556DRAFT_486589 [Suillus plorans]|uniref:Uncharacterized protein n=1 Tax=Suillus plorans TaxID=116603 RepID=A0A9P7DWQ8_9AGAM|nr:uncharacterized protein HD556DRAFT_486589 [Suillus plorans]KAG1804866.1 hypothetical protein HD556DRAFT_486589 [Suillus plorans]
MPVPARVQPGKNIWVAAGDGDLVRVRVCNLSSLTVRAKLISFLQGLVEQQCRCHLIVHMVRSDPVPPSHITQCS